MSSLGSICHLGEHSSGAEDSLCIRHLPAWFWDIASLHSTVPLGKCVPYIDCSHQSASLTTCHTQDLLTSLWFCTQFVCVRDKGTGWLDSHTIKQFSDNSWVSHKSTPFWQCLPGDSTSSHRLSPIRLPRLHSPVTNKSSCHLNFWSTSYRLEIPTTSSLDSINLLVVHRTQETSLLTKLPVLL